MSKLAFSPELAISANIDVARHSYSMIEARMPRIFISYRRSDSSAITGRIYDRLVAEFGRGSVFKDVDSIPYGTDFRRVLEREVASCDVMLVVIGPSWAGATDPKGNRRLDDPNDFVRIEVETGLRLPNVVVIPVQVQGALMPAPADLPTGILREQLPFLNAPVVRDDPDFHPDATRLIDTLKALDPNNQAPRTHMLDWFISHRYWTAAGVLVAVLALIGALLALPPGGDTRAPSATPDLLRTSAVIAQLDVTATEAVLQRTVDARGTENAALLAENTHIAETRTALSVTTNTPTSEPTESIVLETTQGTLEVQIEPLVVQPGEQVAVRTEPGATCLFTPSVGRVFGFDQTSGLILFTADYDPGVTVSVTCHLGSRTSKPIIFRMAGADATDTPSPPTPTPSPTATDTPIESASADTITLTLFRDGHSFTLYVPESDAPISLVGLEFRVNVSADERIVRRLDRDYAAFLGLPFENVAALGAICLRLVQASSDQPVPQACQDGTLLIPQQLATADLFWLDTAAKLERTVFIYLGDTLLGVCGPQDSCPLNWPVNATVAAAAPMPTPTPGYPCEGHIVQAAVSSIDRVRKQPNASAAKAPAVTPGAAVQILREATEGVFTLAYWYEIAYPDGSMIGWIPAEYLEFGSSCS